MGHITKNSFFTRIYLPLTSNPQKPNLNVSTDDLKLTRKPPILYNQLANWLNVDLIEIFSPIK